MTTIYNTSELLKLRKGTEFYDSSGNKYLVASTGQYMHTNSENRVTFQDSSKIELPVSVVAAETNYDWDEVEDVWFGTNKEETRTTSRTGGQKGKKDEELGAVDPTALRILAQVAAFGGKKYERSNYLKGYDWSLSFDALQRHLMAFWEGEDVDPESGLLHTAHASWHCLALTSFLTRGIGTDDRFKQ